MGLGAALVLGAGGHLGSAIVRALVARGAPVTGVVRRVVLPPSLAGVPLRLVHIEGPGRSSQPDLTTLAAGHAVLIDAAAPYPTRLVPRPEDPPAAELARRHVEHVLAPVERTGVHLVHLGSWVTRTGRADDLTSAWARRTHPYFEVKARIEGALLEAASRGLPVSVVSVTMATGPWDTKPRALCAIPQLVAGEHPIVPECQLDLVDVRDVGRDLAELIEHRTLEPSMLLRGHALSFPEAAERLAALTGGPRPHGTVRSDAAVLALAAWETMHAAGAAPEGPPALGMMLMHEATTGLASSPTRPPPTPRTPLDDTLRDAVAWYRRLGYC